MVTTPFGHGLSDTYMSQCKVEEGLAKVLLSCGEHWERLHLLEPEECCDYLLLIGVSPSLINTYLSFILDLARPSVTFCLAHFTSSVLNRSVSEEGPIMSICVL